MTWVKVLYYLLKLAAYAANKAEKREVEEAILNVLEGSFKDRVTGAAAARDDVLSGRVHIDRENDPNRRD